MEIIKQIQNLNPIEKLLNSFFEEYLKVNNIYKKLQNNEYEKNKLYNTLITDSVAQFYIIIQTLKTEITNPKIKDNQIKIVDIGTGYGIPGIIISILINLKNLIPMDFPFNNLNLYLIESNQKKAQFLKKMKEKFNLDIEIINQDCKEYIKKNNNKFEVVISRAVFPMPKIMDIYQKYSNFIALWLYTPNYIHLLNKYYLKINSYFSIYQIYEYQINNNPYYTIIFLRK